MGGWGRIEKGEIRSVECLVGWHVTDRKNLPEIENYGFLGSKWPDKEQEFLESCSDPFRLFSDGAVFVCKTHREAVSLASFSCLDIQDPVFFRVEGRGVIFDHLNEGVIGAIRADSLRIISRR